MAKVFLSRYDKKVALFKKWFSGKCREEEVTQADLGKELGITQSAISQKLNRKSNSNQITYEDLLCFFSKTQATDEEIVRMMRL